MSRYNLTGRIVAITGSTGGLGSALADTMRARGANLVLLDLDLDTAEAQADRLGGDAVAKGFRADVRDLASLEAAMAGAAEHFGRLDIVIANAGVDTMAPMATLEPAAFERVIDINLTGVWRTFRAALPHVQPHRGYLLAISSMAAFVHSPLQASYTASKAGVWAMCDSIRVELRSLGVGVGSAHPTFFRTPMMDDVVADPAGRELWGGNDKGLWKMIPLQTVTAGIVDGIERRADQIVIPKTLTLTAKAPGLFRILIERIGFRNGAVERAIEIAAPSGWHDSHHPARAKAAPPKSSSCRISAVDALVASSMSYGIRQCGGLNNPLPRNLFHVNDALDRYGLISVSLKHRSSGFACTESTRLAPRTAGSRRNRGCHGEIEVDTMVSTSFA
jgi:NAD(P)-dependent dehydrogenase (short-subunit alcohol dehydrogenase family)